MPLDNRDPKTVPSVCPHDCPSVCALDVERLDARTIGRVHGARDNDYTAGVVCAKVARYAERVHHPDRLTQPLRRVGEKGAGRDAFEPLSWDDALDIVADRFRRETERYGPEAVWPFYYAGTMGLVQRDGINRFRHDLKYSRQHSTFCSTLSDSGWLAGVGSKYGTDPREMAESDLIVAWGCNPVHTQVNVMTHVARARRNRGAKFVVVDPYRTPSARQADLHVAPRPGTDGALVAAMMHVLFRENLADRDYLEEFTDCPNELRQHVSTRTPEWAAGITGLDAEEIVAFARLYGRTERSYIRLGYGFSRSRNGAANLHAVSCLPAVTGAWRHRGGGALYSNSSLYGLDMTLIEGRDALDPSVRVFDQSRIGAVLTGEPGDIGDGPPVTAMLIQNTNPAVVAPESLKVREGFLRDDLFVCVHEQFMTETALLADIVLPATTFLEHPDIYIAGGHTFLQVARPVIERYAEARSNHQVLCALAERLGGRHRGFQMTEWQIIDETLRASGYPGADAMADARWHDCAKDSADMRFLNGFPTPDGRFHFKPDWSRVGPDHERMPPLPDHFAVTDEVRGDHPFRLIAAPARSYLNTSFTETPSSIKGEGRPTAKIHPDACRDLGVRSGDRVRIGNQRASVVVHAETFNGMHPDVVVVEGIWPNHAFEEGMGINALVSADPGPPLGGAVFHDTAVWIRPA